MSIKKFVKEIMRALRTILIQIVLIIQLTQGAWISKQYNEDENIDSDNIVTVVNSLQENWIAGINIGFEFLTMKEARQFTGTILQHDNTTNKRTHSKYVNLLGYDIPDVFDSRAKWPTCIGYIRDQGACGACWAFAAVEALGDRVCIRSGGRMIVDLSVQQLIGCNELSSGCDGGYLLSTWRYLKENGVVTEDCYKYSILTKVFGFTGTCRLNWYGSYCPSNRSADPFFFKSLGAYQLDSNENTIMAEIYMYGPAEAGFQVYTDFMHYKSGIYRHVYGRHIGGHAVKIVGWGEEDSVKYWLVANSWGSRWGNMGGYFMILRGQNECEIESYVYAG